MNSPYISNIINVKTSWPNLWDQKSPWKAITLSKIPQEFALALGCHNISHFCHNIFLLERVFNTEKTPAVTKINLKH